VLDRPPTLIVEDTPLNLKLLSTLLAANGFPVTTAVSAEAALELVETTSFGLVLVDICLPGLDGLALTRRLRAIPADRAMVIVAVTANATKKDVDAAFAAGCDGFVMKPVDTQRLVPRIDELLALARAKLR
jgi:CheY-like chemotaxis protein